MKSFFSIRALVVAAAVGMGAAFLAPHARACDRSANVTSVEIVRRGRIVEIRLPQHGDRVVWRAIVDDEGDRAEIRRVLRDVQRDVERQVLRQRVRVIVERDEIRQAVRRVLERIREIRFGLGEEGVI